MRTRPDISSEAISACPRDSYGFRASRAEFLPVGADFSAFAFRVAIDDGTSRFLNLSLRDLNAVAVAVPAFLRSQGIRRVMSPIANTEEQLWTTAMGYTWVLYPYFDGASAF